MLVHMQVTIMHMRSCTNMITLAVEALRLKISFHTVSHLLRRGVTAIVAEWMPPVHRFGA